MFVTALIHTQVVTLQGFRKMIEVLFLFISFLVGSICLFMTSAKCAAVCAPHKMFWNKVNTCDVIVCQLTHVVYGPGAISVI